MAGSSENGVTVFTLTSCFKLFCEKLPLGILNLDDYKVVVTFSSVHLIFWFTLCAFLKKLSISYLSYDQNVILGNWRTI